MSISAYTICWPGDWHLRCNQKTTVVRGYFSAHYAHPVAMPNPVAPAVTMLSTNTCQRPVRSAVPGGLHIVPLAKMLGWRDTTAMQKKAVFQSGHHATDGSIFRQSAPLLERHYRSSGTITYQSEGRAQ